MSLLCTMKMCSSHRYQKSLNRLLKVCYVTATSAVLTAFFSSFLLQPLTVLMKQTRQPVNAIKQSIYLDVYGSRVILQRKTSRKIALWNLTCKLILNPAMPSGLPQTSELPLNTNEGLLSFLLSKLNRPSCYFHIFKIYYGTNAVNVRPK
jgi:hypothetical protein